MSRDSKRRKKNERRKHRREKKARQQGARDLRLQAVTCPNCNERFGNADDPEVIHRGGPCDATPAIMQAMEDFLEAREQEYEDASDTPAKGKIPCRTCGTMHGEQEQSTHFFEGRLVWDGCDKCFEEQAAKFEQIREDHREKWFGKRATSNVIATPNVIAMKPVTEGKYVPSRRESINEVNQIYQGGFIDPTKKRGPS